MRIANLYIEFAVERRETRLHWILAARKSTVPFPPDKQSDPQPDENGNADRTHLDRGSFAGSLRGPASGGPGGLLPPAEGEISNPQEQR